MFSSIGWILLGIAALCVAANQIDDWFARRKDKPAPAEVAAIAAATFATKEELEMLRESSAEARRDGEEGRRKIDEKLEGLRKEFKGDSESVQERVNGVSNQCSALESQTTLLNQRMVLMDTKLDRFIERSQQGRHK